MLIPKLAGRLSRFPLCCTALLLASIVGTAFAEPLSFDSALALAVRETPALRAEAAQVDAARHAAIPAGALPDPKLVLGIDNLPIEGPDRFSLTRDGMTMRRIGVMQEFPNDAKRGARVAAARGRVALTTPKVDCALRPNDPKQVNRSTLRMRWFMTPEHSTHTFAIS